jgi:ribonucleoside-diphosphate reductase alpha chain
LGLKFRATIGRDPTSGEVREVFLSNHRVNSMAGIMASDAAVVASIALQYGVPLEVLRHALMRDAKGNASGPLAVALDQLEEGT